MLIHMLIELANFRPSCYHYTVLEGLCPCQVAFYQQLCKLENCVAYAHSAWDQLRLGYARQLQLQGNAYLRLPCS